MNRLTFTCAPIEPEATPPALRVAAQLDGKDLSDGLIDICGVLFGGAGERSSFYFYTCSCGVAGCDGYHMPLEQRRENGQVIWTIEDEKLGRVFGATRLVFDAKEFDAARAALRAELDSHEAQGIFAEGMTDTDWDEDNNPFIVGIKLADMEARYAAYYEGQAAMTKRIEAASDPDFPAPLRYSWGDDGHPETERFYEMPAVEIAAILLRLSECLAPEDEPNAAELPQAAEILRDLARTGDIEAAEARFAPLRRFLKEDEMDGDGVPIFGRDAKGVFVRHP